jgi:dihydrofolate reductase
MEAARGIIVAVSPERVIGVGGKIPWHYPADLKRFKRLTMGGTIIMGRRTWESIGSKPLPGRRNVVITRGEVSGADRFSTLEEALATCTGAVWFIGGAKLYEEAMRHSDFIDVTCVPDHVDAPDAVRFPPIDESIFSPGPLMPHEDDPRLQRRVYTRRAR